jgi:hypothetical protein
VQREGNRVRGRLGSALDRDLQASVGSLEEEIRDVSPLGDRAQDSLAGGPEREKAVESSVDEEVDQRPEGIVVYRVPEIAKRSDRGSQSSSQQPRTLWVRPPLGSPT